MTTEDELRTQVRGALAAAGIRQTRVARELAVSTKHLNGMLTGKNALTLEWAEKIADLCDLRLSIRLVPALPDEWIAELFAGGLS